MNQTDTDERAAPRPTTVEQFLLEAHAARALALETGMAQMVSAQLAREQAEERSEQA